MIKITALFLLITNHCFSQDQTASPNLFDKFINQSNIEWVSYLNDNIRFTKINLSEILRNRFEKKEIKVSIPESINSYEPGVYRGTKYQINYGFHDPMPIFDSLGNMVKTVIVDTTPADKFDSISRNLVDVTQLLYVQSGKLKSYIPFVSPMQSIVTSLGVHLGVSDYFVAAFNYKYDYTNSPNDKIISLEQTVKRIKVDSIGRPDIVKQLYGRNLVETLWPYVLSGKLQLVLIEGNRKIGLKELTTNLGLDENIAVPVYGSTGNIETGVYSQPVSPSKFKEIEITQQWFYNQSKNIVFNTIPFVTLFAYRFKNGEYEKESSPILKIVFK